jgi:hypothetical protein
MTSEYTERATRQDAAAPSGLPACPIDGKPATMLAGNCGHSWSAALRGATERPLDVERLGRAAAALKDIGEYPTDRAYGTALAAEYARLTPTTTTPETEG